MVDKIAAILALKERKMSKSIGIESDHEMIYKMRKDLG